MDLRTMIQFEAKKNDHTYYFLAPMGTPLGESYDALYDILDELLKMAQRATEDGRTKFKKEDGTEEK